MTREDLIKQIRAKGTFLCVGLDTDVRKLPGAPDVEDAENPIFAFNKAIIDATAPYCVAYKPNVAFYECEGVKGWEALRLTCRYLKENYPNHFVIADAKRGDIGNTAKMYARAFFEDLDVDAVTVAPYMGEDSVTPFLGYPGKWVILLALTSNKGAFDFELIEDAQGEPLYKAVLRKSGEWAGEEQIMYVAGATKAEYFTGIREIVPRSFLLVPGVGAQGGSLEEVCRFGMTSDCGLLVNSSRGIIYASSGADYAEAAAREASKLAEQMRKLLV